MRLNLLALLLLGASSAACVGVPMSPLSYRRKTLNAFMSGAEAWSSSVRGYPLPETVPRDMVAARRGRALQVTAAVHGP